MTRRCCECVAAIASMLLVTVSCDTRMFTAGQAGADWPRYQHDNRLSGVAADSLAFPLERTWAWQPPHAPAPAWPEPAQQDYWHQIPKLNPLVTYDRANHVAAVGHAVYFASSSENCLRRLDSRTGNPVWEFFTAAPNRTAPVIDSGRVYFGSDDGYVYCLEAARGRLLWKYRPGRRDRKIIGNGHVMSSCPVRTGVVVENGVLYGAAGIFPKQDVYVFALNASSGTVLWSRRQTDLAPQGYPLLADSILYIPNSRSRPRAYAVTTGERVRRYSGGAGGDYLALAGDGLVHGISDYPVDTFDEEGAAALAGHRTVSEGSLRYILDDYRILALDTTKAEAIRVRREFVRQSLVEAEERLERLQRTAGDSAAGVKQAIPDTQTAGAAVDSVSAATRRLQALTDAEFLWIREIEPCYAMIISGQELILGLEDSVMALHRQSGRMVWSAPVEGRVYGLAAARGRLYASTDTGEIVCFSRFEAVPETTGTASPRIPDGGLFAEAAKRILTHAEARKGFCLVLDCVSGGLPLEIARNSDLRVVCVHANETGARGLREEFAAAGFSGERLSVFAGELSAIGFTDYCANIIVSERYLLSGRIGEEFENVYRLLRPFGGSLVLEHAGGTAATALTFAGTWIDTSLAPDARLQADGKLITLTRGRLPGSGEWTHLYGNPENTACSEDSLVNDYLVPQWFGRPGPRNMADRHHRAVAPVFKNGRIHIPGFGRIITADAYNGTPLWEQVLPDFKRVGVFRDAGNMAVTDDLLYAALTSRAVGIDPATGTIERQFILPQLLENDSRYWGYLAVSGDRLLGSARKPQAGYYTLSWQTDKELWYDYKPSVTSDYLFSLDRLTGKTAWTYRSGSIVNPTITAGGGRLYFLESQRRSAIEDEDGLIELEKILGDSATVTALDLATGQPVWQVNPALSPKRHHIFFAYADDILIAVSSRNQDNHVHYDVQAFDAASGALIWVRSQDNEKWIGGDHGEQHLHPAIVGDRVYAEPYCYDLHTGEPVSDWKLVRNGHGCGTISASENSLFYRAGNPALCNLYEDETTQWINAVNRPGCWINMIPAGGLLLMPEASSGCTCDFPMQTSMAYLPLSRHLDIAVDAGPIHEDGSRELRLSTRGGSGTIHYTLDGSDPDEESPVYRTPLRLTSSTDVRTAAVDEKGWGRITDAFIPVYASLGRPVALQTEYSSRYSGGGAAALTDGLRGEASARHPAWQGYEGVDLRAIIDLGAVRTVREVDVSMLQHQESWIFLPDSVIIEVSVDGRVFTPAVSVANTVPRKTTGAFLHTVRAPLQNRDARYIRVRAVNIGRCPSWHAAAGETAWLFVDEIIIET
ncbi:PQQ-binding-like beta-propeller repeat protein [bacterium]|nr:PQQ-binding-like beta-propeller repeat protein [bacterium]